MAWTAPRTWTVGEVVTKTILDTHVRDNFLYIHGDAGVIAFSDGATFTKSQSSQLKLSVDNVNAGTAAYAEVSARNAVADTDAMRLLCFGTGWTTTGAYLQDGAALVADSNLSGGLSVVARHASGILRFYTAGSADANERLRITSTGLVGIGTTSIDEKLHLANSSGAVAMKVENEDAGTNGDPTVIFALGGTSKWTIGCDDSDSEGLKIASGGTLGTTATDLLRIYSVGSYSIGDPSIGGYHILYTSSTTALEIISGTCDIYCLAAGNVGIWSSTGPTVVAAFFGSGLVVINDTANGDMTQGLTINQGANDNQIFAVKSSDVAHGMTTIAETDTYGSFQKGSATSGGFLIRGFSEATAGCHLQGYGVTDNTSKSTSGVGYVTIDAFKASGTGTTSPGANAALVVFRDGSAGTAQFIFDVEGDSHENGTGWTAYDDHDDLALLEALDHSLDRRLRAEAGEWLRENEATLEAAGIVHFNRDTDAIPFINRSRLGMLLVGAVRQLGREVASLKGVRP